MPDPTLTRYDVDVSGGEFETADGPFYRCEEADRLIQALREQIAEQAQLLGMYQLELGEGDTTLLRAEMTRRREAFRAVLVRAEKAEAEVGALRRALDAAQLEKR